MTSGAVVLLSGGLDSTTCLAVAKSDGFDPIHALSFLYGQRHEREMIAARDVAYFYKVEHHRIEFDLGEWGGSALTDTRIAVPKGRGLGEMAERVPVTYVPCRNSIFLAFAASLGETLGINHIFFGANCVDYSGYPDCRPEFVKAMRQALTLGSRQGTELSTQWNIHTPLIMLSKKGIIELGMELQAPYHLSWSCYLGGEKPCLECDSCKLRMAGFAELGLVDPLLNPGQDPAPNAAGGSPRGV